MTGNRANIPRQNSDLGGGSPPSREWYNFFRRVGDFVNRAELGGNTIVNQGDTIINNGTGSLPVAIGYSEGESFPQTASVGQKFYRTDLNWLCFYDGTRWLTCHENEFTFVFTGSMPTNNSTGITVLRGAMPGDYAAYVTRMDLAIETGGGVHDAMNYVIVDTYTLGTSNTTSVPLASINTSSGIALNTCERFDSVINTACPITDKRLIVLISHNGSTPNTTIYANVFYRKIVT